MEGYKRSGPSKGNSTVRRSNGSRIKTEGTVVRRPLNKRIMHGPRRVV